MKFGGNKYGNQFISTEGENEWFVHDIHKIAVDEIYTQVTAKKGIKRHDERSISAMYKYETQILYMEVIMVIDPDSITKS